MGNGLAAWPWAPSATSLGLLLCLARFSSSVFQGSKFQCSESEKVKWSTSLSQVYPIVDFPLREISLASQRGIAEHSASLASRARILQQVSWTGTWRGCLALTSLLGAGDLFGIGPGAVEGEAPGPGLGTSSAQHKGEPEPPSLSGGFPENVRVDTTRRADGRSLR